MDHIAAPKHCLHAGRYMMSKMSKRKQATLGELGFSKKVCHRDGEVDVIIPEFVEEKEIVKRIQCLHCSDKFVKKISASDCS